MTLLRAPGSDGSLSALQGLRRPLSYKRRPSPLRRSLLEGTGLDQCPQENNRHSQGDNTLYHAGLKIIFTRETGVALVPEG